MYNFYITFVLFSISNLFNREQFKEFVFVRPFRIKNIPTSYMFVKSPKTLFIKNFSVVKKLRAVFTVFAIKACLYNSHFDFFYYYFSMLSICEIVYNWICFSIEIFPVWRYHDLKVFSPAVCKLMCFSCNCYRSNYLTIFFFYFYSFLF